MPFTYTALLAKLDGTWSGTWQNRTGSGNIELQFDTVDFPGWGQLVGISEANLTATGCTGGAVSSPAVANWQSARTTVDFTDGSVAGFAFMFPAYNNETLVGDFVYLSGACEGQYGAFVLFKQQQ